MISLDTKLLKYSEKTVLCLREIYSKYGYTRYNAGRFEEYDFYMQNKNFLKSDNILTFTDTNGKLMALKPDITLSIIKNQKEKAVLQKVYYDENVYRSTDINGFREIRQTGLECIGNLDMYCVCEVISLALQSLASISGSYLLDLSDLRFINGILSGCEEQSVYNSLTAALSEKNVYEIDRVCREKAVSNRIRETLIKTAGLYGTFDEILPECKALIFNDEMQEAYEELSEIAGIFKNNSLRDRIRLDFSVVNDMNYYNGIIFNGFIENVPQSVLSGGRYDNLIRKMGINKSAVGFAVYLDLLEKIEPEYEGYDVDTLLLYDDTVSVKEIVSAVGSLQKNGSVKAQKTLDGTIKYKTLCRLTEEGVKSVEQDD